MLNGSVVFVEPPQSMKYEVLPKWREREGERRRGREKRKKRTDMVSVIWIWNDIVCLLMLFVVWTWRRETRHI